eukprot:TRINITY_DN853_c0_g1_i1.p2 TRINITY_DN853_c0_g1~~TRINITY_DN853_c0_g1_i1.p2  ORF type:complete len:436 (+),score=101.56 TRINITY_DN853_c0_g1_i1:69-1310(+)
MMAWKSTSLSHVTNGLARLSVISACATRTATTAAATRTATTTARVASSSSSISSVSTPCTHQLNNSIFSGNRPAVIGACSLQRRLPHTFSSLVSTNASYSTASPSSPSVDSGTDDIRYPFGRRNKRLRPKARFFPISDEEIRANVTSLKQKYTEQDVETNKGVHSKVMDIKVTNWFKEDCGSVRVPSYVFNAPLRGDILHRVIVWQLACRRAGTAKTKTRAEVSGSGRKMRPQKGGGVARQGDKRAPHMRTGGKAHGPKPRDYSYPLPVKVKKMGLRVALSTKLQQGNLFILDSLSVDSAKTKEFSKVLRDYQWDRTAVGEARKQITLVGDRELSEEFRRASGNLPNLKVLQPEKSNVYDFVKRDVLILTRESVDFLSYLLHEENEVSVPMAYPLGSIEGGSKKHSWKIAEGF